MKLDNQTTKIIIISVAGITLITVAYFGVINPILKKLGVKEDSTDKEAEKLIEKANESDYWNETYYTTHENSLTLTEEEAIKLAKDLDSAIGTWYKLWTEDESLMFTTIKKLKTKSDLSFVIYQYNKLYNKDLLTEMQDDFESEEMTKLLNITNKLK